jgi:hypothetical protein
MCHRVHSAHMERVHPLFPRVSMAAGECPLRLLRASANVQRWLHRFWCHPLPFYAPSRRRKASAPGIDGWECARAFQVVWLCPSSLLPSSTPLPMPLPSSTRHISTSHGQVVAIPKELPRPWGGLLAWSRLPRGEESLVCPGRPPAMAIRQPARRLASELIEGAHTTHVAGGASVAQRDLSLPVHSPARSTGRPYVRAGLIQLGYLRCLGIQPSPPWWVPRWSRLLEPWVRRWPWRRLDIDEEDGDNDGDGRPISCSSTKSSSHPSWPRRRPWR